MIENIQQTTPQHVVTEAAVQTTSPARESSALVLGALCIVVILNFAAFHSSLRGYFLADDFAHVDYLKTVFSGHAHLLVENFYSNWMQTLGTSFYRPFISLTLAFDYLIWGANPNGFHISNFVFQTLSSVFLFLALNCMFPALAWKPRFMTALLAASLFACHPLHPEVVSWIIARVDSVCTTFLFLSLWLYLLSSKRADQSGPLQILSLGAFTLSLMSKEMAITLPPTIFLYELINLSFSPEGKTLTWQNKFKAALIASKWHIALLLLYLGFRTIALGTLFGGYGGSVGDGLKDTIWRRWFQEGCLFRLVLPFNQDVTHPKDSLRLVFKLALAGAFALAITRAFLKQGKNSALPFALSPFAIFAVGWFVIALAPTVQVFDITENLQGGRFVYLATAPVVLFLSALTFGTGDRRSKYGNLSLLTALSIALAMVFTISYTYLAVKNNKPWQEASRGVSNIRASVEKELEGKPPNSKIAVLNLPPHNKGAHMLYNAAMFGVTLKPPLSKEDLTGRVITFEPVTFGDANLINRTRFKQLLADKNLLGVFVWQQNSQKLVAMKEWRRDALDPTSQSVPLKSGRCTLKDRRDSMNSPVIDVPSTDFDFVDLELKVDGSKSKKQNSSNILLLSWTGAVNPMNGAARQIALPLRQTNTFEKYRFSVGELKTWIGEGRITGLQIDTSLKPITIDLKSAQLTNASDEIPDLKVLPECNSFIDSNGTIYIKSTLGPLSYDATKIKNAKSVRYEISAPDSWFEHYSGTLRDTGPSQHISDSGKLKDLSSSNLTINLNALKVPGFYELRIMALDADDKVIGYVSNPINFQLSGNFFKHSKE
ncbi:MAG: hypothetical protein C0469_03320 [Cyanobacteria bacterium DS2.3.42]|nr:hypothetical protein [Cyanobacteria bacterium DS2.3.42]